MAEKHFENDLSRSLAFMPYRYKAPDIMQAGLSKVDFLCCYKGRFVAIEAKEVKWVTCNGNDFSPGQKQCLTSVAEGGGIALAVVNFGRGRKDIGPVGTGRRGVVGVWRIRSDQQWTKFVWGEEDYIIPEGKAGLWQLQGLLDALIEHDQ